MRRPSNQGAEGPFVLALFGAQGDLSRRKLYPALYHLEQKKELPKDAHILGLGRNATSDDAYRDMVAQDIREVLGDEADGTVIDRLTKRLHALSGDFRDKSFYDKLSKELQGFNKDRHYLFYLAIPPSRYVDVIEGLSHANLTGPADSWPRLVVEKPFGHDRESAVALNNSLLAHFGEHQIFRIDHYLGKETVQNILVFRFANGIFEPLWNQQYVDHVQILAAETVGTGKRAGYYDENGALKDMVQSHLLQLLALTAMEPPTDFSATSVRDEKVKLLRALRRPTAKEIASISVRAQYAGGVMGGKPVPAYTSEKGIEPNSTTETQVALKANIDNWRWAGVPFYLRTGKRLPTRATGIVVVFKRAPHLPFAQTSIPELHANTLTLRIQPNEGISLSFGAKEPGPKIEIRSVNMDFSYGTSFAKHPAEAYERLLHDALGGDQTLFTRSDEVEAAWDFIQSVSDGWGDQRPLLYSAGTWGPPSMDELLEKSGRSWMLPDEWEKPRGT